ncbi:MAG: hypothetical protein LBM69_06805 [Lachnospiraceae bacterium]|jgi:hypothetical protein|nr:hypothetical protein [Lachnospiraceae bacterium]
MQKLRSILFTVIIMVVTASTGFSTVYAATDSLPPSLSRSGVAISPFYTYAYTVEADLSISGTTATVYVSLDGNSSANSVNVAYSLQKKSGSSWSTVKTWTASSSGRFLNAQSSYSSLTAGTQYRAYATFTVTGTNGGTETITDYSATHTC